MIDLAPQFCATTDISALKLPTRKLETDDPIRTLRPFGLRIVELNLPDEYRIARILHSYDNSDEEQSVTGLLTVTQKGRPVCKLEAIDTAFSAEQVADRRRDALSGVAYSVGALTLNFYHNDLGSLEQPIFRIEEAVFKGGGVRRPYSATLALGTALLHTVGQEDKSVAAREAATLLQALTPDARPPML